MTAKPNPPSLPSGGPSPARAFLSRNLLLVGLASLLTDMSTEMVYPILPLFLTATLGASPRCAPPAAIDWLCSSGWMTASSKAFAWAQMGGLQGW